MTTILDHSLIQKADDFAAKAHAGHTRSGKEKEPYINHLREVAELVRMSGGSTEEICAGLLHDSVEDTETTLEDIMEHFGSAIHDLVAPLTDDPESNKLPTRERKALQAEHMRHASTSVKRIKLADQISNVRCIAVDPPVTWDTQKCIDYIEGAKGIALECEGVSVLLGGEFQEAYAKAMAKHSPL